MSDDTDQVNTRLTKASENGDVQHEEEKTETDDDIVTEIDLGPNLLYTINESPPIGVTLSVAMQVRLLQRPKTHTIKILVDRYRNCCFEL